MNILIVYHEGKEKVILSGLKKIFVKETYSAVKRDDLQEKDYLKKDLVVVIGGDGTFLKASHLNKDLPMVGINPHPDTREGFYSQMTINNFEEKIRMVLDKKYKIIDMLRLKAEINNMPIKQLVLNEVYIGDITPYNVFNYEITVKGKKEFQRGSGVIIGTPTGSYAWLKSSGGELMRLNDKKYQFVARELYEGKHTKDYRITKGILDFDESIEIIVKSPGIAVVDSRGPEIGLKISDHIIISTSKDYLRYIKLN